MKTSLAAIAVVLGVLWTGSGSITTGKAELRESAVSLIARVTEARNDETRRVAVEELLKSDKVTTQAIIDALKNTDSSKARDSLVHVLSQKKDERSKPVLLNVLKDPAFSARARESAVIGLGELSRVVNRSTVGELERLYKLQNYEGVKKRLAALLRGLEPMPLKDNVYARDPSSTDMQKGLEAWAASRPGIMDVTIRGKSVLGKPILLAKITDKSVSDDDKQIVLFTSTHCGGEEIGATSLLHLTKWLLGEDETVQRIRKKIIVLIMPCVNPDGWDARRRSGRPYHSRRSKTNTAWNVYGINIYDSAYWFGEKAKVENPEGLVVKGVADEYQPDASMDVHATQRDTTMPDSTGFSWGDFNAHSFQPLIVEEMNRAMEDAGCLAERPAVDAGRIKVGTRIRNREHNYYWIGDKQTIMSYLYLRYHTLAFNCETAYDFALVARARRLLEIGTETWRNEFYPGYPSRQLGRWGISSVAAWGDTASKRRKSRIELWRKMNQIHYGGGMHHRSRERNDNRIMSLCATTTGASEEWFGNGTKNDIMARLSKHPKMNHEYLAELVKGRAVGIRTPPHYALGYKSGEVTDAPIQNGLAMRVFIPYDDAEIYDTRIDGYPVERSEVNGYIVRQGPGTIVQFNIPPKQVGDVHAVSLKYNVPRLHRQGFDQDSDWNLNGG